MENVPIESLGETFGDLARRVEQGKAIVLTREGKPLLDLVPHAESEKAKGGIDWEGERRFLAERGIDKVFSYISPDFDAPLPEDFLLQPLPDPVQALDRK